MPTSKQKTGRQYIINKPQGMPGSLPRKELHIISAIDEGRKRGREEGKKKGRKKGSKEEENVHLPAETLEKWLNSHEMKNVICS